MNILYVIFVLAILTCDTDAHGGHDHGNESAPATRPSISAEHPSVSGRLFEVVVERCEADKIDLYISDSQTNQPVEDAQVEAMVSGDITLTVKSQASQSPGVYPLPLKAKDGNKVTLEINVSTPKTSEVVSLTVPQWPKASGKCAP